jgi:hypothetical protein
LLRIIENDNYLDMLERLEERSEEGSEGKEGLLRESPEGSAEETVEDTERGPEGEALGTDSSVEEEGSRMFVLVQGVREGRILLFPVD